jgi:hypothetical protein
MEMLRVGTKAICVKKIFVSIFISYFFKVKLNTIIKIYFWKKMLGSNLENENLSKGISHKGFFNISKFHLMLE